VLNSDFKKFFGSGVSNSKEIAIKEKEVLGKPFSAQITLPPLSVVVFKII
jgi:1,4-alpha-glucan branching enzyme